MKAVLHSVDSGPLLEVVRVKVLAHAGEVAVGREAASIHHHHRVHLRHAVHAGHLGHHSHLRHRLTTEVLESHGTVRRLLLLARHGHLGHHRPHALRLSAALLDLVKIVLRGHGHILALEDLHVLLELLKVLLLTQGLDELLRLALLLLLLGKLVSELLRFLDLGTQLRVLSLRVLQTLLGA